MTKVKITENRIIVRNHAENPIICAGISAIVQTLAGAVINLDTHIKQLVIEPGYFDLELTEPTKETECMFLFAKVGLLQIEKSYPNSVDISVDNY